MDSTIFVQVNLWGLVKPELYVPTSEELQEEQDSESEHDDVDAFDSEEEENSDDEEDDGPLPVLDFVEEDPDSDEDPPVRLDLE